MSKIEFSRNYFAEEKNPWTKSTSPWTTPARSTMDRRPWPASGACQSSASGPSGAQGSRGRGGGGRGKHGGPDSGLTGARKAVEQRRNDGEGGGGEAVGVSSLGAGREGKEGWGMSSGRRGHRGALL
jgi:hypothetical protein